MSELPPQDVWEARTRSARDTAVLLPFVVLLLLLPPIIVVFSAPQMVAGIPLIVVYIYIVWAASVLVAFLIARRLQQAEQGARNSSESSH